MFPALLWTFYHVWHRFMSRTEVRDRYSVLAFRHLPTVTKKSPAQGPAAVFVTNIYIGSTHMKVF